MIFMDLIKENKKKRQFYNLMQVMKLDGFYLVEYKKITNGHILKVGIPVTSNFKEFEKKKEALEDYFGAIVELEKIRFSSLIQMKIITKDIGKYPFAPVQTYANNFWLGKEFDTTDFFVDLDKEGHLLLGGQSGGGKTFGLAAMLTNLIATNSDYIELYLNQTMKGEIGAFKKCKCVKSVCYTLEEVSLILEKIAKKIDDRSKLFTELGIKNLTHYIQRTGKKMKRIFFVVEEASFLNISDADSEEVKAIKQKCLDNFIKVVRAGRSSGVHLIMVVQRSTLANLSSEIKAQMFCATTWQRSDIDSKNIIEVTDAKTLQDRELYVWSRTGLKLLKLPWLDEDFKDLKKYVPEIITFGDVKVKVEKVKEKDTFETYTDIRLEDYNKIESKRKSKEVEEVTTVELEPAKKKRGRPRKKGVVIDAN